MLTEPAGGTGMLSAVSAVTAVTGGIDLGRPSGAGADSAAAARGAYHRAMTRRAVARHARTERHLLADLLTAVGPEAPTLCEGWLTRDLAAHLVVRERRPDAAAGLVVPPLQAYGERLRAERAAGPYPLLVEQIRRPPWWSPVSNPLLDAVTNTVEFFVHHEDVRRAAPNWQPRELSADLQAALWSRVGMLARLGLRRFPASVVLQAPGHGETTAGAGGPGLRVIGAPGELVLLLSGRQQVARVQPDGPGPLVDRLRSARLGI